jgi:L-ascorbate metabolism protein UlaG (beta-lactamase superfamily)
MKNLFGIIILVLILIGLYALADSNYKKNRESENTTEVSPVTVTPISHATAILSWGDDVIYTDPVGEVKLFQDKPKATIIVVTDIHGDHLNVDTLKGVLGTATLIVPQAVKDKLPQDIASKAVVLNNGETNTTNGFSITAIPMYNLPESPDSRHVKGRGNGYVIEKDGYRVYIAGDTAGIPEMRALKDIDLAFVPMNLPFTMSVEQAADAVLTFKPKHVYPYHYRGQDGLSDINKFKELVNAGNPEIDVVLLNWYPQ